MTINILIHFLVHFDSFYLVSKLALRVLFVFSFRVFPLVFLEIARVPVGLQAVAASEWLLS